MTHKLFLVTIKYFGYDGEAHIVKADTAEEAKTNLHTEMKYDHIEAVDISDFMADQSRLSQLVAEWS